jgi:hypothetical protein
LRVARSCGETRGSGWRGGLPAASGIAGGTGAACFEKEGAEEHY